MHVTHRAILTALLSATIAAGSTLAASAQSDTASPMAPRLLAPHNVAFIANTTDGVPPGVTHDAWVGGHGTWSSATEDGMLQTHATFTGLVPNGHYSLFTRHTENKTLVIQPIDHSGVTNSFVASAAGAATITVTVSQQAVPGDEIMLIYHTDAADHPKTIGKLGTDAFVQMRLIQP
jgi:hypothetical protein